MQATTILRSESVIEKLREVEGRGIHVVLLEYPAAACVLAKMKDSWISTRYHRGRKTLMSSGWLIFGTIAQLMLAYLLFMVVVFSAAGMGRTANLGRLQLAVLNFSMYVLPALCVLSAGIVCICTSTLEAPHRTGGMRCRWRRRPCTWSTPSA